MESIPDVRPSRSNPSAPHPGGSSASTVPASPVARILAVDDDADILRLIASRFVRPNYVVDTAADGRSGLDRVNHYTPHLVITDVNMPGMDGWTFVRALRTRPETVLTPIIFLTSQAAVEDRIRGFHLGADDYLPKPFSLDELELRVQGVLRRAGRAKSEVRESFAPSAGMRGALDQISLAAVLVLLESERAGGVLVLEREGESARLHLMEGRVVRAVLQGQAPRVGAECVYAVLAWPRGRFGFTAQEIRMDDEIGMPTAHLLMEGARRSDEASRA